MRLPLKNSERPVLAIETTGALCSISIYANDRKHLTISLSMEKAHSRKILSLIDSALSIYGIATCDLAGVCVSEGPGSFTGLRLGFAAAKGIAFGQEFGIMKVPTFKSLAYELSSTMKEGSRGLIVTKAALEESYIFGFEAQGEDFSEVIPLTLIENELLVKTISEGCFDRVFGNVIIPGCDVTGKSSPEALWIAKYAAKKLKFAFDHEIDFIEPYYFKNFTVKVK